MEKSGKVQNEKQNRRKIKKGRWKVRQNQKQQKRTSGK